MAVLKNSYFELVMQKIESISIRLKALKPYIAGSGNSLVENPWKRYVDDSNACLKRTRRC